MCISIYFFLLLASDYSHNLSFLKQKYRQRVFTTTIRNQKKFRICSWWIVCPHNALCIVGRGVGQGGTDVNSKTVAVLYVGGGEGGQIPGQGWSTRGWAGWSLFCSCLLVITLAQTLAPIWAQIPFRYLIYRPKGMHWAFTLFNCLVWSLLQAPLWWGSIELHQPGSYCNKYLTDPV
jgi:hypothetical protein